MYVLNAGTKTRQVFSLLSIALERPDWKKLGEERERMYIKKNDHADTPQKCEWYFSVLPKKCAATPNELVHSLF